MRDDEGNTGLAQRVIRLSSVSSPMAPRAEVVDLEMIAAVLPPKVTQTGVNEV